MLYSYTRLRGSAEAAGGQQLQQLPSQATAGVGRLGSAQLAMASQAIPANANSSQCYILSSE